MVLDQGSTLVYYMWYPVFPSLLNCPFFIVYSHTYQILVEYIYIYFVYVCGFIAELWILVWIILHISTTLNWIWIWMHLEIRKCDVFRFVLVQDCLDFFLFILDKIYRLFFFYFCKVYLWNNFYLKTGSHYLTLNGLELTNQTKYLCLSSDEIKGMHCHTQSMGILIELYWICM